MIPDPSRGEEHPLGEAVWWAALLLLLGLTAYMQALASPSSQPEPPMPGERLDLVFQGKYYLGMHALMERLGMASAGEEAAEDPADDTGQGNESTAVLGGDPAEMLATFLADLESPRDRLALVPLQAELGQEARARQTLESVRLALDGQVDDQVDGQVDDQVDGPSRAMPRTEELAEELAAFESLLDGQAISAVERDALVERYGWFAELAMARAADARRAADGGRAADAGRVAEAAAGGELSAAPSLASIRDGAQRVALVSGAAVVVVLILLFFGSMLALLAWRLRSTGRLRSGYRSAEAEASRAWRRARFGGAGTVEAGPVEAGADRLAEPSRLPYLQTLVVFVVGVQLAGLLAGGLMMGSGSYWPLLLQWLLLPVLLWPMRRGRTWAEIAPALGLTRGRSIVREAGAGILAYVAAMPLLACGLLGSMIVSAWTESAPHHPVVDWIGGGEPGALAAVVMLAVFWAPIMEEGVFRGAFYHYLRGRMGVLASAVVVGLVFAGLHPQGLAGIPFLLSLAVALALAREWRGSSIAPITMHMVHNGLAVTAMSVLFG